MRYHFAILPAVVIASANPVLGYDLQSLESGIEQLFPEAQMSEHHFTLSDEQVDRLESVYNVPVMHPRIRYWTVSNGGWIYLDQVYGYDDVITYLVGLEQDGSVRGIEILVCAQGFCDTSAVEWRAQFSGKADGDLTTFENIVEISGQTLSVVHVAEGVKKILAVHEQFRPFASE